MQDIGLNYSDRVDFNIYTIPPCSCFSRRLLYAYTFLGDSYSDGQTGGFVLPPVVAVILKWIVIGRYRTGTYKM